MCVHQFMCMFPPYDRSTDSQPPNTTRPLVVAWLLLLLQHADDARITKYVLHLHVLLLLQILHVFAAVAVP